MDKPTVIGNFTFPTLNKMSTWLLGVRNFSRQRNDQLEKNLKGGRAKK